MCSQLFSLLTQLLYFQLKKLNKAIKFVDGHICRSEAKEFHPFVMETEDPTVRSFRGVLQFDVKIVRPQQQQQHEEENSQEENGNGDEMGTKRVVIDISDQLQDTSGTTKQVANIVVDLFWLQTNKMLVCTERHPLLPGRNEVGPR